MRTLSLRIGCAVAIAVFTVGGFAPPKATGTSTAWRSTSSQGDSRFVQRASAETKLRHPRIQYMLYELTSAYQTGGLEPMWSLAEQRGIQLNEENELRVVIETADGGIDEVAAAMEAYGGKEETRNGNLLQVRVRLDALPEMADLPQVTFIRLPFLAFSVARTSGTSLVDALRDDRQAPAFVSEGVQVIGADVWQNAGFRGQGIKVAIIDVGFFGYQSLLGTELPPSVATQSFRSDGDLTPTGEVHGTAISEIIHDVAPEAQLFLINFETDVEWANAVDFAVSQGVDIISSSIGFLFGPYNGTGFISDKVTEARNAGVFWAQSAGNHAREHWQGEFSDPDGNGLLNFAPDAEINSFSVPPDSLLRVFLSWDDWPASSQDYDLVLFLQEEGGFVEVDRSTNVQDGSQPPFESIIGITGTGGNFGVGIQNAGATQNVRFQLFTIDFEPLFAVPETSLTIPADSPGAVTAGATFFRDDSLEPFSSQGPTVDGRTKPDLVAPDGVSTASFGPESFFGTSASAPHVAGAAALVKSANPSLLTEEIQGFLEARALPMGPPGKDNTFGSGRLSLGPPGFDASGPPPSLSAADARIEIVFPHDSAGNPTGVVDASLANIGAFLFFPNSLAPVPCNFGQPVYLYRAFNSGVDERLGTGSPRLITKDGKQITVWEYNDVDVSGALDPLNKYYFFLGIDGLPSNPNIWAHGEDARTIFPQPDVPTGVGPVGSAVDARIEIVFPHDAQGNPKSVVEADLANIAVDLFTPASLVSVPPDSNLTVRLLRSLNNGVQEPVGTGQKQIVTVDGLSYPRWLFNDVDVSAARDPLNKYYFRVAVDGLTTRSNVWSHGADARTTFPQQDVPASSCQQ